MPRQIVRVARANTAIRFRTSRDWGRAVKVGATMELGATRAEVGVGRNGKRATDAERCTGWLGGKSSEGRNPKGGCGAKQSHEARAGSNR
jgi:hypothetical protein